MGNKAKNKRNAMQSVTINWPKAIGGAAGLLIGAVLLVKAIVGMRAAAGVLI